MPSPFCSFNGIFFDWATGGPSKIRQDRVDYYNGSIMFITQGAVDAQTSFDQMWALQQVVNVRPIGDGSTRVYIDAWQPVVTRTLSLKGGTEIHGAVLVKIVQNNRLWHGVTRGQPATLRVIGAEVSFLLMS